MSQEEQAVKLFDVVNFDVIHFLRLGFAPKVCYFVSKVSSFSPVLAISEVGREDGKEGNIRLVKVEQVSTKFDQN